MQPRLQELAALMAACGQAPWGLCPGVAFQPSALTSAAQLGSGRGRFRGTGAFSYTGRLPSAKTELKTPERNLLTHRNFRKGSGSKARSSMDRISLQDKSLFQLEQQMSLPFALSLLRSSAARIPGGTKGTCPWPEQQGPSEPPQWAGHGAYRCFSRNSPSREWLFTARSSLSLSTLQGDTGTL